MYHSTLILLAAGGSRVKVERALQEHPHARVWSLNATRHPREELQFEIHGPSPLNKLNPSVPAIVSPGYTGALPAVDGPEVAGCPQDAPRIPFPLVAACELGFPFFELSHDYMLAYAALLHTGRLPEEARVPGLSLRPLERIIMCGIDSDDPHHFARSRGAHFWLGLLRGLGVDRDFSVPPKMVRPFFYGQKGAA